MEKFSKFTDETVGVNGFVQQPYKPSFCGRMTGLVLLLLRFPLGILAGFLFYLVEHLIGIVSGITPLASLLRLLLEYPLARTLLFSLGFHRIGGIYSPHKQSIRLKSSPSRPSHTIQANDIVLVNHSSYIDLLYLLCAYSPLFVIRSKEGTFVTASFFQALTNYATCISPPPPSATTTTSTTTSSAADDTLSRTENSLKELLAREYASPLVIFPEQAPSNNKVILSFPSFITTLGDILTIPSGGKSKQQRTVHLLGLKYDGVHTTGTKQLGTGQNPGKLDLSSSSFFSPCLVTGRTILRHGIGLMMQGSNHLSIWRLPIGYDPQPQDYTHTGNNTIVTDDSTNPPIGAGAGRIPLANGILGTSSSSASSSTSNVTNTWSNAVRQAFATLLNVTPVRQDYRSHSDFVRAYSENLSLKKIN